MYMVYNYKARYKYKPINLKEKITSYLSLSSPQCSIQHFTHGTELLNTVFWGCSDQPREEWSLSCCSIRDSEADKEGKIVIDFSRLIPNSIY